LMMEGSGAGSVIVTNGSRCKSGRPKNIGIRMQMRIRNTGRKVIEKSQNSINQSFSYYFCLMTEGSVAWSVIVTNGSGCGSRRPKTYGWYGSGSTTLLSRSCHLLESNGVPYRIWSVWRHASFIQ
jgi:hypothetical protein